MDIVNNSLPNDILTRAQKFYSADFHTTTCHVDESPRKFNTCAFALGNQIYITPDVLSLPLLERDKIFIHELAHIQQQQPQDHSANIETKKVDHGQSIDQLEDTLETQAQLAAQKFIEGHEQLPFKLTPRISSYSCPQTYIEIDGIQISSEHDINQKHQLVIDKIKGGLQWLRWAIQLPNHTFQFNSELNLLNALQIGLHGTDLLLISPLELLATPGRIAELDEKDINRLMVADPSTSDILNPESEIGRILTKNKLYPQLYLNSGRNFLQQTGIADKGLFQAMNIRQLANLYDLEKTSSSLTYLTLPKKKEAVEFALLQSQSASEFIDLFMFYALFLGKFRKKTNLNYNQRQQLATSLLQQIFDALYPYQNCLQVEVQPSAQELKQLLHNYITAGGKLGFTRLSLAASEVIRESSDSIVIRIDEAFTTASEYFDAAQDYINNYRCEHIMPSQDGLMWRYSAASASIDLDANGYITLNSYSPKAHHKQKNSINENPIPK